MESYKVDDSRRHVKLYVNVGTTGSAITRVYLNYTTKPNLLEESVDKEVNKTLIPKVGINKQLKFETLIAVTILNFSNIPPAAVASAIKMTHITYILTGGPDGDVPFESTPQEVDDTNKKRVIITKKIDFV